MRGTRYEGGRRKNEGSSFLGPAADFELEIVDRPFTRLQNVSLVFGRFAKPDVQMQAACRIDVEQALVGDIDAYGVERAFHAVELDQLVATPAENRDPTAGSVHPSGQPGALDLERQYRGRQLEAEVQVGRLGQFEGQ